MLASHGLKFDRGHDDKSWRTQTQDAQFCRASLNPYFIMKFWNSMILLLPAFFCITFANPPWHDWTNWKPRPTATVDGGIVIGVATQVPESAVTVHKFLGIPFAAPAERFSPPKPPAPFSSPYDASYYRPACLQQFNYPEAQRAQEVAIFNVPPPPGGESEDCLSLNIYVPATEGNKTVIFWIHGASFRLGRETTESLHFTRGPSNLDLAPYQYMMAVT